MRNRNDNSKHTNHAWNRDEAHQLYYRVRASRSKQESYAERHNCDAYVHAFNLHGMEVENDD